MTPNEISHYESLKKKDIANRKLIKKLQLDKQALKEQLNLSGVSQPSKYDFFCSNNLGQNWDFSEWKTLHEWDGTEYLYVG